MLSNLTTAAYLVAALLFILSLAGLSRQETARRGNWFGIVGMVLAVLVTLMPDQLDAVAAHSLSYGLAVGGIALGGIVGVVLALRVAMTAMPELTAALHSFVGLAAVLVGYSTFLATGHAEHGGVIHDVEIYLDIAIGALTFTGSVVAYLKLAGKLSGRPLLLPMRHTLNGGLVLAITGLGVAFVVSQWGMSGNPLLLLAIMTVLAGGLGVHLVAAIGGADMPVVVSLLNSYSGWTAAAAGFMLENDLLIVTGALVGSSGAILSYIMCEAMNRSIWNVVFGGFGAVPQVGGAHLDAPQGEVQAMDAIQVASLVRSARDVVIVPGYGLAVAQAQHMVHTLTQLAEQHDVRVRYAIHPVAGRLPGHMNVLLAEAGVPYDIVLEMDDINPDLPTTDLVLVIGANDIVNPSALDDPTSPIYGMPVIEVWNAKTCLVFKRSMNVGYAGIANPLFFKDNTRMVFGDAGESLKKLNSSLV